MRLLLIVCSVGLFLLGGAVGQGEALPPCHLRPHTLDQPWIPANLACLEQIVNDPTLGAFAFTALAVGDDGTLYAAHPTRGTIYALTDTDGDLLPDSPSALIEGLTLPNGLAYAEGTLYISGGSHLYRWSEGRLDILVDDLPANGAYWTGGVTVHDERVYVGIPAACPTCLPKDRQGAIVSFGLDGTEPRIEMSGLLQPHDFTFAAGGLYATDPARDSLVGANDFLLSFDEQSRPLGMTYYPPDGAIPRLQDQLLLVLSGSTSQANLRGYVVVTVDRESGNTEALMPAQPNPGTVESNFTNEEMNLRGSGFFPHRPFDVTITPEGWVYISLSDGRILALRP